MDIEHDHGEAGAAAPLEDAGTAMSAKDLARRKFTIAGIGASGVLLTLVSQPGMASEICASPSSSMSGGLQSRHGTLQTCAGKTPAYYSGSDFTNGSTLSANPQLIEAVSTNAQSVGKQSANIQNASIYSPAGWPSQVSPSTAFRTVFPCSGLNASTFGKSTLGAILHHAPFDTSNLGMYMVATYLNILSGRINVLTTPQLQAIWYDWQTYGYYSPTAGVKWDASRIVFYLTSTMS